MASSQRRNNNDVPAATIGYYVMSAIMAMERVRTFAMTQMMQVS